MLVASIALADSSITPQCDADDWEAAAARVRAVAARAFDGYAEHAWVRTSCDLFPTGLGTTGAG